MKRRVERAVVVLTTVMVLFFYPLLAPPAHRIDDAHFRLIKGGMTEAEVEGIFGVPAGQYDWTVAPSRIGWGYVAHFEANQRWNVNAPPQQRIVFLDGNQSTFVHFGWPDGGNRMWTSRHGAFCVVFDQEGRVIITEGAGAARREYPWRRWWRQWTGK